MLKVRFPALEALLKFNQGESAVLELQPLALESESAATEVVVTDADSIGQDSKA